MGDNTKGKSGEDLYRDIVDSTNTLIWRTDRSGRLSFLNPAWNKNLGYSKEEMLGRPFSDFQMSEATEHYINAFRNCLIGEPVSGHETSIYSKGGEHINLIVNMIPLYDSNGDIIGTQGTAFDITERKHADDLLQYISAKDELTGLYNLHTFMSMTEQQIKTAIREKKELLIIYSGLDNLQPINERHGNEVGDRALLDAADIFRKTFREADILGRTGGGEFVMSTLASRDTENMVMKRLKDNIDSYNSGKEDSLKLVMSFGSAFYNPEGNSSINDMLSEADDKMHNDRMSKK